MPLRADVAASPKRSYGFRMIASDKLCVLVTGATGTQGGAVSRALRASGVEVRALVRDPSAAAAQELAALGVVLAKGDLEDGASLASAARGVGAVFSVQSANPRDTGAEARQARALVEAAKAEGVRVFVQSTVSGVDLYLAEEKAGADGAWDRAYWQAKADVESAVMAAGFEAGAILRPAFMMENFIGAKAQRMFPGLSEGVLRSAIAGDAELALVAADDVAQAAILAIFNRNPMSVLELASDRLTMAAIATTLSEAWKRPIRAETESSETLVARGFYPGWVSMQGWLNAVGYPARPEQLLCYGVAPTPLKRWARGARDD